MHRAAYEIWIYPPVHNIFLGSSIFWKLEARGNFLTRLLMKIIAPGIKNSRCDTFRVHSRAR